MTRRRLRRSAAAVRLALALHKLNRDGRALRRAVREGVLACGCGRAGLRIVPAEWDRVIAPREGPA